MLTSHIQEKVFLPVFVDEKLATTLTNLWKAGLTTEFSCQGGPSDKLERRGYIIFRLNSRGWRFMNFLIEKDENWKNAYFTHNVLTPSRKVSAKAHKRDAFEMEIDSYLSYPRLVIRFPHDHIPTLEKLSKKWLKSEGEIVHPRQRKGKSK